MRGINLAACVVLLATAPGCYDYGGFFSKQPDAAALQMGTVGNGTAASLTGFQKVTQQTFDALPIGVTSTPFTITIKNTGEIPAEKLSFSIQATDPGAVKSFSLQNRCKDTLLPKIGRGGVKQENTCQVDVIFSPVKLNGINVQLLMSYENGNGKPMSTSIPISGSADTRAYLKLEPVDPSLWVGIAGQQSMFLGAVSSPYTSTAVVRVLYNGDLFPNMTGISPASSVKFSISPNASDGAFSVQSTSPSQTVTQLCPGIGNAPEGTIQHSCYLFVQFSPTAKKAYSGAMLSVSYANGSEGKTVQMPLSGTGNDVIQPAQLSVAFNGSTYTSYDFGSVAINPSPLSVVNISITNNGTAPAVGISSTLNALKTQGFQISQAPSDTNCALLTAAPGQGTLGPGSTCQIGVAFNPQSAGAVSVPISITFQSQGPSGPVSAGAASPFTFTVNGKGVNPAKLIFTKSTSAADTTAISPYAQSIKSYLFQTNSLIQFFFKNIGDVPATLNAVTTVQPPFIAQIFHYHASTGGYELMKAGGLVTPNAMTPANDFYMVNFYFQPTQVSDSQAITEIFPYSSGSASDQLQANITATADPNEILSGPYFAYSNIIIKPGLSASELSAYLSKVNLSYSPAFTLFGPSPLLLTAANLQANAGATLSGSTISQGPLSLDFSGCLSPGHQLAPASAKFSGYDYCLKPSLNSSTIPAVDGAVQHLWGQINYDDGSCKGALCKSVGVQGDVNFVSPPVVTLSANSFDFGSVAQAASSPSPQGVVFSNTSKLFNIYSSKISVSDPNDPNLDLIKISASSGNTTYLSPVGTPPNSVNNYGITIVPKRSGTFKINLSATYSYVDSTGHMEPVTLPIAVTVTITSAPKLAATPPALGKTLFAPNVTSDGDLVVSNNGTGSATLATLPTLSGEFSYAPSGGPGAGAGFCAVGTVLAPGATCKLTVRFTPLSVGIHTLPVTLSSQEDPKSLVSITISGTATTLMKVFAGSNTTCILDEIRILRCWGRNAPAALNISTPGAVNYGANPVTVSKVSIGPSHICTVASIPATNVVNQVYCWGDNTYGQLGMGLGANSPSSLSLSDPSTVLTSSVDLGTNVQTGKPHQALDLAVGAEHSCALLDDGAVKCWGRNDSGQLGNPVVGTMIGNDPTSMGNNMVAVNIKSAATGIGAGAGHTCALLSGGTLKCWGDNFFGQLGQVTSSASGNKLGLVASDFDNLNAVDFGASATAISGVGMSSTTAETCTLSSVAPHNTTGVKCFGKTVSEDSSFFGVLGVCWARQNGSTTLAQSCGQGLTDTTELGKILTDVQNLAPTPIGDGTANVVKLAVGHQHSCVLLDDKSVRCWGFNSQGQLGNSSVSPVGQDPSTMGTALAPIVVDSNFQAVDLAVGDNHTCVVLENNTIKCWGSGTEGASSPLPMADTGSKPVSQLPIVYSGK